MYFLYSVLGKKKKKFYFLNIIFVRLKMNIVGINEPNRSIGPWAMPEDIRKPENGQTVR